MSNELTQQVIDEIDALRQQLAAANKRIAELEALLSQKDKRIDEIMQEYAAIKFKGVGEQHIYPVPRKRHAVREGD